MAAAVSGGDELAVIVEPSPHACTCALSGALLAKGSERVLLTRLTPEPHPQQYYVSWVGQACPLRALCW